MSFAPPPSNGAGTPPPPPGAGPRSTTIPGSDSLAGAFGQTPPPTPSQFVNGGPTTPYGPSFQTPPGMPYQPGPPQRGGRGGGLFSLWLIIAIIGGVIGIGAGIWAFTKANDATDQADRILDNAEQTLNTLDDTLNSVTIPEISIPDVTVPPVSLPITQPVAPTETTLPADPTQTAAPTPTVPTINAFADGGAPAVIAAYEAAISGEPSRVMQVILYPDYAFATAQDANNPTHVDEYPFRDGVVGASSPVQLVGDGDLEANLFNLTDVDWTFIARAVAEAPGLVPQIEEGQVSHIIVERSVFTPDFAVEVHVYVDGPRGGGYLRYTPAGAFIAAVV